MKTISIFIGFLIFISSCKFGEIKYPDKMEWFMDMTEIQLSSDEKGHFLYQTQIFSHDDKWIVYDTRNDGSKIGSNCCIEIINIESGEVRTIYKTENQTDFGPGVGAPAFHPLKDTVIFIHGIQNCNIDNPYGFTRRTGVAVDVNIPGEAIFMDARNVVPPFTPGALRGGTHAHSWSGDGEWLSFTYNDDVMAKLETQGNDTKKDLRMIGVMTPFGSVDVIEDKSGECFSGEKYSFIVSRVVENPEPGSNMIDRAYEEGWVGKEGYNKQNGEIQKRALAFLGDTRNLNNEVLTEVFIIDIPEELEDSDCELITGTANTRPQPPKNVKQRRLTFTGDRKYPGVQGPRHWLRSSPDGSVIYFLMKDEKGIVQVNGISPNGGEIKQYTYNKFPVETGINISPNGRFLAYGSHEKVFITHIESGITKQVSPDPEEGASGLQSIEWSNNGEILAYNRNVNIRDKSFYQIFILKNN